MDIYVWIDIIKCGNFSIQEAFKIINLSKCNRRILREPSFIEWSRSIPVVFSNRFIGTVDLSKKSKIKKRFKKYIIRTDNLDIKYGHPFTLICEPLELERFREVISGSLISFIIRSTNEKINVIRKIGVNLAYQAMHGEMLRRAMGDSMSNKGISKCNHKSLDNDDGGDERKKLKIKAKKTRFTRMNLLGIEITYNNISSDWLNSIRNYLYIINSYIRYGRLPSEIYYKTLDKIDSRKCGSQKRKIAIDVLLKFKSTVFVSKIQTILNIISKCFELEKTRGKNESIRLTVNLKIILASILPDLREVKGLSKLSSATIDVPFGIKSLHINKFRTLQGRREAGEMPVTLMFNDGLECINITVFKVLLVKKKNKDLNLGDSERKQSFFKRKESSGLLSYIKTLCIYPVDPHYILENMTDIKKLIIRGPYCPDSNFEFNNSSKDITKRLSPIILERIGVSYLNFNWKIIGQKKMKEILFINNVYFPFGNSKDSSLDSNWKSINTEMLCFVDSTVIFANSPIPEYLIKKFLSMDKIVFKGCKLKGFNYFLSALYLFSSAKKLKRNAPLKIELESCIFSESGGVKIEDINVNKINYELDLFEIKMVDLFDTVFDIFNYAMKFSKFITVDKLMYTMILDKYSIREYPGIISGKILILGKKRNGLDLFHYSDKFI